MKRISHKTEFLEWAKRKNVQVLDAANHTNLRKGQMVTFTNRHGITFGPREVLGFTPDGCVYHDHDAYWFACRPEQLTPVEEKGGEE